jgi:DNA topoisomerase I
MHVPTEPTEAASIAGLHYVSDNRPGIHRLRSGKSFRYLDPQGGPIRDTVQLQRIKALVIPPAWNDVWICPDPHGHIQATGRDARGRKQYRYHNSWRIVRDESKYDRMIEFGRALPKIRSQARSHLRQPGLGRHKVLATVVRLLELSCIRVGNDEYARQNRSYGLTTLQDRHAKVNGSRIQFHFRGKHGKEHIVDLDHPVLARIVRQCQDLPGQELFQYLDEQGLRHDVTSSDVNSYLREISGHDFTAKDFRTWTGTVLAAVALGEFEHFDSQAQAKKNIVRAIESVAGRLGNTPTICKKCYVHPVIYQTYLDGTLTNVLRARAEREIRDSMGRLRPEEAAVLTLLQQRLHEQRPGGMSKKLIRSLRQTGRKSTS